MTVKLRLQRFGQKHLPFYRIVAADARFPRDGRFLERVSCLFICDKCIHQSYSIHYSIQLGTWNPLPMKDGVKEVTADTERIKYWISVGAQPSDLVAWILSQINVLPPPPVKHSPKYQLPKAVIRLKSGNK